MIELSGKDARELLATELDALGFTDEANFIRNDKLCGEDVAARNAIQAAFAEGTRRATERPAAKAENAPAQPTPQPQCDCLEVMAAVMGETRAIMNEKERYEAAQLCGTVIDRIKRQIAGRGRGHEQIYRCQQSCC